MTKINNSESANADLRRRDVLRIGGYSALGIMLALATGRSGFAQTAGPSLDNIKANLSTLRYGEISPNYADAWPTTIGTVKGYFKEVGITDLKATLTEEYIPGLVSNSLDMTHSDTDRALSAAIASNMPIKIIGVFRQRERWILAARKGIDTPADLKGKKVSGGALAGRNTWVLKQILIKMGLDPDKDVEIVPMTGASNARQMAVISGTIDAAVLFPRHRAGVEQAGGKFIHDELFPAPQEAIVALGPWLTANEDTAYAWMVADIRARQWLFNRANKDEAYKIMREAGYEIPPAFEAQYQEELDMLSPDGGFDSSEVMDTFIAQLKESGDVPAEVNWRDHAELKYLWAAQDALGLPRRPSSI
ncbi:ABC transporter substrate-binding protein [Inquilinus sp. YAF38]|uniref:ABC transporter substrate-binding protein n=1 Tax=Inquilinus sp. YAF38 TaxID=3233084 RepID=UPI003F8FC549